jgi:orotate phosphoribosyltransferase
MNDEVLELLKKSGSIFSDSHFIFTSGKHAPRYIDKMALFAHPIHASEMGKLFAEKYKDRGIEVVVAPAMGGIILSQWTAYHLSKLNNKDIIGIYTEKTPDSQQIFTRGYDKYVKGKNVLIVEDNVTTGGSVRKVVDAVNNSEGKVIEVCSMTNINPNPEMITDEVIGAKYSSLTQLPVVLYDEKDCPMCKENVPINTEHGHGKKYLEAKKQNQQ